MAATLAANNFCSSSFPRNASQKPVQHTRTSQNADPRSGPGTGKTGVAKRRKWKPSRKALEGLALETALSAFIRCGAMEDAIHLFDSMPRSNAYVWNVMIRGFVDKGLVQEAMDLYRRMKFEGVSPDYFTYPFLIKACGRLLCLADGQKVTAELFKVGLDTDVYVGNSLISMYAENGCVELAERVFNEMGVKDLVSWNSMISGYVLVGDGSSALSYFCKMQKCGMKPDRYSILGILGAVSVQGCLMNGKEIHSQTIRGGYELDIMIQTSIIDMYCKCGRTDYAERLFDQVPKDNVVTWNAMIDGYSWNSIPNESFFCLTSMINDHKVTPDCITMINLLTSCSQILALLEGKSIHSYSIRKGLIPHTVLETALICMYGDCKELKGAKYLFSQMAQKNLVSWNALIVASLHNGQNREGLSLFQDLLHEPFMPDAITIASILPAYAEVAMLREGKQIHGYAIKMGTGLNTFISNSTVYMYAKCGDLETGRQIFDKMLFKDIVSWNVIMMAYAIHGYGSESLKLFSAMMEQGIEPNDSTFVSLLSSCSISGMVNEGWEYFSLMKRSYNIDPVVEHYGHMLDLLGRAGDLDRAKQFIEELPFVPNGRIWGSLLTASRNHKNIEMAEFAAENILSLEHDNTGCYILLSNMYAEAGRYEEVERVRNLMLLKGLKKTIGQSIVEACSRIHSFTDHDNFHEDTYIIYYVLYIISKSIGEDIHLLSAAKFRLLDLEKRRAKSTGTHSVRLAVSFGLINTAIGNPVLVRKNNRICESCHSFAKKTSQFIRREIIIGDSKVFHHFKHGKCSCGDFW